MSFPLGPLDHPPEPAKSLSSTLIVTLASVAMLFTQSEWPLPPEARVGAGGCSARSGGFEDVLHRDGPCRGGYAGELLALRR